MDTVPRTVGTCRIEASEAAAHDLAEEARRRMAADAYLRRHGIATPTQAEADRIEAEIARELSARKNPVLSA